MSKQLKETVHLTQYQSLLDRVFFDLSKYRSPGDPQFFGSQISIAIMFSEAIYYQTFLDLILIEALFRTFSIRRLYF